MFLCARPNGNYIIPARRIAFTTARAAVIQRHREDGAIYRIFEENSKPKGSEKFLGVFKFFFFFRNAGDDGRVITAYRTLAK